MSTQYIRYPNNSGSGSGSGSTGSTGANTSLSNLTSPTAVNQSLVPGGSSNLGSSANPWITTYTGTVNGGTGLVLTSAAASGLIASDGVGNANAPIVSASTYPGETFTTTGAVGLSTITVSLLTSTASGTLSCQVFNTSGGVPTGAVLFTSTNTVNLATVTGTLSSITFSFSSAALSATTQYAFALVSAGFSGSYTYRKDTTNSYAGGSLVVSNDSGGSWGSIAQNMTFAVSSGGNGTIEWQDGSQGTAGYFLKSSDTSGTGTWAALGSISLTSQVSGNLPLSQTSGSISLTGQVSGILPILNVASVSLSANVTGNLPVARLNSGTSADATTFWRGDGTWATPAGGGGGGGVSVPANVYNISSGTFTVTISSGTTFVEIIAIAGGAGGGSATTTGGAAGGGGGGGGGIKWFTASSMSGGVVITGTIGNGGAGGASGGQNNGIVGGNTSVTIASGSATYTFVATGGTAGAGVSFSPSGGPIINSAASAGGTCSSADVNAGGNCSTIGICLASGQAGGANGGSGAFGFGGGGNAGNNGSPVAGNGTGPGGGGGGATNTGGTSRAGGNGSSGVVVIKTYN